MASRVMNGNLEPNKFDRQWLPAVVAIILVSVGVLAWEWRNAHTPAVNPDPMMAQPLNQQQGHHP